MIMSQSDQRKIKALENKLVVNGCTKEEEDNANVLISKIKEKYKSKTSVTINRENIEMESRARGYFVKLYNNGILERNEYIYAICNFMDYYDENNDKFYHPFEDKKRLSILERIHCTCGSTEFFFIPDYILKKYQEYFYKLEYDRIRGGHIRGVCKHCLAYHIIDDKSGGTIISRDYGLDRLLLYVPMEIIMDRALEKRIKLIIGNRRSDKRRFFILKLKYKISRLFKR